MAPVTLEFGGGLQALFDNVKTHSVTPSKDVSNLGQLIMWVKNTMIRDRHDMFVLGDTLRPGVLVLINGVDWELHDRQQYRVCPGDTIAFVSTLHGG